MGEVVSIIGKDTILDALYEGDERAAPLYNFSGGSPVLKVERWDGEKWKFARYEILNKKRTGWFPFG